MAKITTTPQKETSAYVRGRKREKGIKMRNKRIYWIGILIKSWYSPLLPSEIDDSWTTQTRINLTFGLGDFFVILRRQGWVVFFFISPGVTHITCERSFAHQRIFDANTNIHKSKFPVNVPFLIFFCLPIIFQIWKSRPIILLILNVDTLEV